MKLVSVYRLKEAPRVLYDLLRERLEEPDSNISHRSMPTWRKHLAFIRGRPYAIWYVIRLAKQNAGAIYLDRAGNVGIALFRPFRGKGLGAKAVAALMRRHKRPSYFANINGSNVRSKALFRKLGFKPLQVTFELRK